MIPYRKLISFSKYFPCTLAGFSWSQAGVKTLPTGPVTRFWWVWHAATPPTQPPPTYRPCVGAAAAAAACLLGMQSPRKVPKLTKIKRGQVARADLKESCEIFYVLAIGWPLIYATRMELQSVNSWPSTPTLGLARLHFSQIAWRTESIRRK